MRAPQKLTQRLCLSALATLAFGSALAIVLNASSTTSRRLFIFSASSSTCSRSFACASVRNTVCSRNLSADSFARSRTMLKVAATISRCCRDNCPTCWPAPPPPMPAMDWAGL